MQANVPSSATVPSLVAILAQVPDPRHVPGRRHAWTALLLFVVVALLCGANSQGACARWGQHVRRSYLQRLGFPGRGPSQPTLHRVLRDLDVVHLETQLSACLQLVRSTWTHQASTYL